MSIAGLVTFLILIALTSLFIAMPLLRKGSADTGDTLHIQMQKERLLVYYERVLTNVRDLDEDHATGKMPDADYAAEREDWMLRGVQVLRTLDALEDHSVIPDAMQTDEASVDEAIDDAIEATIAARRKAAKSAQ